LFGTAGPFHLFQASKYDQQARAEVEQMAMRAVADAERTMSYEPVDNELREPGV